jgi:hypothetical protein
MIRGGILVGKKKKREVYKDEDICYRYSDRFLKKERIKNILLNFLLLFMLISVGLFARYSSILAGFIMFSFLAWALTWENHNDEEIFIHDGILKVVWTIHLKLGFTSVVYIFKDITGVAVGKRFFTVYGNIVSPRGNRTVIKKKYKFPLEIINVEELISFIQSKIITETVKK